MGANQEKLKTKMKAYPDRMEANQENIEVMAGHCKWVPHTETAHMFTAPQGWSSDVLRGTLKGPMFRKRGWTRPKCSNSIRD
jgi:hypothetical protein